MANPPRDVGASVRARLLDRARAEPTDFQGLLMRYALERLLYRLSVSPYRARFVLNLRKTLKEGEDSGRADYSLPGLLDELHHDH